jgi:hypothetical protein
MTEAMHSESQWRYRASRMGLRLVKYKQSSPAYRQFGPYALVDTTARRSKLMGLDARAVERTLFASQDTQGTSDTSA